VASVRKSYALPFHRSWCLKKLSDDIKSERTRFTHTIPVASRDKTMVLKILKHHHTQKIFSMHHATASNLDTFVYNIYSILVRRVLRAVPYRDLCTNSRGEETFAKIAWWVPTTRVINITHHVLHYYYFVL